MTGSDLAARRERLSPEQRALLERRLRGRAVAGSSGPPGDGAVAGAPSPPEPWPAEPPAFFAEPAFWQRLERTALRAAARAAADPELAAEAADEPRVEHLAAALVAGALRRLGVFATAGESHTAAGLIERCGVAERHPKVVRRWLEMLADEGWLERAGAAYASPRPLPAAADEALRRDDERHLDVGALAAILTGERHALEYYLAGGSSAGIEAAYREAPMFAYCNRVAEAVVAEAAAALPPGRPLRVLEVGAGTGGTTASLLPLLPAAAARYAFTDVSAFFLDLGRRKFEAFPFVRYALLDLERDPAAQGFAAGGFDLVIAAHVLHATRRIAETLAHVHALLAPGGLLVLLEETRFRRLFNFSMGFLPGFDRFEDAELRSLHPLLDAGQWRRELAASGFEAVLATTEAGSPAAVLGVDVLVARAGEPPPAPLTLAQERIWAFERRHPGTSCYNVAAPIRLAGALDRGRLAAALGALAGRHDALRAVFESAPGGPRQRRRPAGAAPPLPSIDLAALPAAVRERESERAAAAAAAPPFELDRGPLLRAALVRIAPGDHLLVVVCHHLVTDGWSCARIAADLDALHAGRPLPPPPPAHAGLARAEQRRLAAGEFAADLEWWRARAGALRLDLPRREPPPGAGFGRGGIALELPPEIAGRLRDLARAERATLFAVLLAALAATLVPWARGGEVAVAVPFGQRDAPELAAAVGLFVSLLPVRVRVDDAPSFRALLGAVRDELAGAFAHPRVPCARLAAEQGRDPLDLAGGVMFNLPGGGADGGLADAPPGAGGPSPAGGLRFEPRGSFELGCEADLAVYAVEEREALRFRWVYRRVALDRRWVEALAGRFGAVAAAAAADPDRRLSELVPGAGATAGGPR